MPQGLYCAEEVQRRKGIIKKLSEQKNGGRIGLRRHLEESSWIPPYFSISTSTLVLSLYCHHVSKSVNCSTRFKLLCVTLGWTSVWYWYYNSWHCSPLLSCWVVVMGARKWFIALVDVSVSTSKCFGERTRAYENVCKWTHQSFAHFAQFCTWIREVFYMEFHRRKSMGCSKTRNQKNNNKQEATPKILILTV